MLRATTIAIAVGGLVSASAGPAAAAGSKAPVLRVSPATPIVPTQSFRASFRTTVKLPRGAAYLIRFAAGSPVLDNPGRVSSVARIVGRGAPRGKVITVGLRPRLEGAASAWCTAPEGFVYLARVAVKADGRPDLAAPRALENLAFARVPLS